MNRLKKILKIVLIILVCLVGLLFATPYLFKGKIVSLVKKEINKNINARVDFEDVDISFFRHFPQVSIGLDGLQVTGKDFFAADTLIAAKRLDATVDIMSFFRGSEMKVRNVFLLSPRIHAIVTKEGFANWDIVKADTVAGADSSTTKPFNLQLQKYALENGYVKYTDAESDMHAEIENLNHSGSGDFTADEFILKTNTSADAVTFTYGAITYLAKVKTIVDADININNKNNRYSFSGVDALLNDLLINGKGHVQSIAGGYDMDISFKTPSSDFKKMLSLIPAVYATDFDKVKAEGKALVEGNIKGVYSDSTMPGYHIAMQVKDGSFKYTDLPKAISQINFDAVVDNPDGETDNTIVDIKNGHLQMDKDPFDFRVLVKKPLTSMFIDAAAKGRLNLSDVANYIKLENGTSLSGLLNADVAVKGNVSDLEKQQFGNFYAAGTVDVNKFNYTSVDYPTGVKIHQVNTVFSPAKVMVNNLSGQFQNSNFTGNGSIDNLLSYLISGKPLHANINFNADQLNLNDWIGVSADRTATGSEAKPFVVPANLDVVLNTRVGKVLYDKLDIRDLNGSLQIRDEAVNLDNVNGAAMDGVITVNGSYSTKESKANPAISLSYDVNQVDIQKTFYAFNTVQKLMPIGKFLSGKLTSALSANGRLGEHMDIDMSTLSGNGTLFLIEGFLSKFAPLEKIASTLNVNELQQITIKNVRAIFEFSNGKMLIKPFSLKVKDIDMEIGGLQGFGLDEPINYAVNLKLPRALMGPQGNQLVNSLVTAVNAKGIPMTVGETVNLKLDLEGTIKKPLIKVDLKQSGETLADQMKEQVKDFAQAKIDSAKNAARDTLASIKKQLAESAKEELRNKLFGIKDTSAVGDSTVPVRNPQDKTKESVKGLLDNLLKKKKKDTVGQQ